MPEELVLTEDMTHALLDALTLADADIEAGNEPWKSYAAYEENDAPDEPLYTRTGYTGLLRDARKVLEESLNQGRELST